MQGEGEDGKTKLRLLMMALPFYMLTMSGKIDIGLDNASISELMKLPQAQMSNMNVH
jgi:hypothetical protein